MSPDSIRKLMHAAPFKPFSLRLADGRSFRVPHPDFISMSKAGRTLLVMNPDRDEDWEFIDVFLVLGAGDATEGPPKRKPRAKGKKA